MIKKSFKKTRFDKISSSKIRRSLKKQQLKNKIIVFEKIDSTNTYAKSIALEVSHGTVVISDFQTSGRGRIGREFFSPSGSGIYMSIVVHPEHLQCDASLLTIIACVAVCNVIEKHSSRPASIKWVNDIFMSGKKVCGILTEAGTSFNHKDIDYFVVGIGLNVSTPKELFPGELQNIAGSLEITNISRNIIISDIIIEFMRLCSFSENSYILDEYKKRSIVLGKNISYIKNGASEQGTVIDINNQGNLIVKHKNGQTSTLISGEISLGSQNFAN